VRHSGVAILFWCFGFVCSFRNWQCVTLFYWIFWLFCVYLVLLTLGLFSLTFQRTLGSFMTVPRFLVIVLRSTFCGYLRSNHSSVKDVKQDRRRKSVSDASVKAARKDKNHLRKVARRRGSIPQDRRAFYGAIRSHSCLKKIHEQAQRDKDPAFQEGSYLRNFYNFAKKAVAGTIGGGGDSPQLLVEVANRYYPEKY
jgi:hypothetical protein